MHKCDQTKTYDVMCNEINNVTYKILKTISVSEHYSAYAVNT